MRTRKTKEEDGYGPRRQSWLRVESGQPYLMLQTKHIMTACSVTPVQPGLLLGAGGHHGSTVGRIERPGAGFLGCLTTPGSSTGSRGCFRLHSPTAMFTNCHQEWDGPQIPRGPRVCTVCLRHLGHEAASIRPAAQYHVDHSQEQLATSVETQIVNDSSSTRKVLLGCL